MGEINRTPDTFMWLGEKDEKLSHAFPLFKNEHGDLVLEVFQRAVCEDYSNDYRDWSPALGAARPHCDLCRMGVPPKLRTRAVPYSKHCEKCQKDQTVLRESREGYIEISCAVCLTVLNKIPYDVAWKRIEAALFNDAKEDEGSSGNE